MIGTSLEENLFLGILFLATFVTYLLRTHVLVDFFLGNLFWVTLCAQRNFFYDL